MDDVCVYLESQRSKGHTHTGHLCPGTFHPIVCQWVVGVTWITGFKVNLCTGSAIHRQPSLRFQPCSVTLAQDTLLELNNTSLFMISNQIYACLFITHIRCNPILERVGSAESTSVCIMFALGCDLFRVQSNKIEDWKEKENKHFCLNCTAKKNFLCNDLLWKQLKQTFRLGFGGIVLQ